MSEIPSQRESKKKRVEKTQKTLTSQPARPVLPVVPMAKRPRTATFENNRTKNSRVTNSIRGTVSGAVATPDVISASNPSNTSFAMKRWAAQSPHPNSSVSAPTSSEVLSAASGIADGSRSVMHQKNMLLAFVLNAVKRLLEQHTIKYQPFLPEDKFFHQLLLSQAWFLPSLLTATLFSKQKYCGHVYAQRGVRVSSSTLTENRTL
jgi:hypothetical protein